MKAIRLQTTAILFIFVLFILQQTTAQNGNTIPAGWAFNETSTTHGIIVFLDANPTINDYQLQPGDFIGAFYTDENGELKCAGADFWLGDENIIFPVFGDDPETPEKDGFAFAEIMQFKVFSQMTQKSYNVGELSWDNTYPATNKWYPMGLSAINAMAAFIDFDLYISADINPACTGQAVQLSAELFAGQSANITYTWWSEPAGLSSNQPAVEVIPDGTTTYFMTADNGIATSGHQMQIEVIELPDIEAGDDITISEENSAALSAVTANYTNVFWETSGDGAFDDATLTTPVYTPGPADILSGTAYVTVTASPIAPCEISATDQQEIVILPLPSLAIEEALYFCENEDLQLNANAENYEQLLWTTGGDGTFSSPAEEETVYFPGPSDLSAGMFVLNVCATALAPLNQTVCRDISVELTQGPVVNSPSSRMVCSNDALFVNSIAARHSSVLWTTGGDGTFANPATNNTYYYPGEQDKIAGSTILTIFAFGQGPCEAIPAQSNTNVIVLPSPQISMPEEVTIVEEESHLIYAELSGGSNPEWSTSGDGTFVVFGSGFAEYYPGDNDFQSGQAEVTASMAAVYPCVAGASATMLINLHRLHEIEIPAGWTGFSTFINHQVSLEEFFAPIINDLVIAQSQNGVFWPQGGLNTFSGFSPMDGYKLKMNNSRTFTITGPPTINSTIQLQAGWNLIPVVSCGTIDVQSVMSLLGQDLIVIKDVVGNGVVWPAMGIQTLYSLLPGRAYLIAVSNSTNLDYSMCTAYKTSDVTVVDFTNTTPWSTPEQTTITHTIAFSGDVVNLLEPGDIVAAFNDAGHCTGLAEYVQAGLPFALVVNGDEAVTPEIEGMVEGEIMRFKVYRSKSEIFDMELTGSLQSENPISHFVANGLSVAESLHLKSDFANSSAGADFKVYPNPSTGKFEISAGEGAGKMVITDVNGKMILEQEISNKTGIDMRDFPRGMYIISLTGNNVRHIEKLILN